MTYSIQVKDVSKTYKNRVFRDVFYFLKKNKKEHKKFLDSISFSIQKGTKLALIGRNGSGKTTLLRLIAGTLIPDEGEIKTSGEMLSIIYAGRYFNPDLTVKQNIMVVSLTLGLSSPPISRMKEILDFADLDDCLDVQVKRLSKGMRAKLVISLLFFFDFETILIDETLDAGDKVFSDKFRGMIHGQFAKKTLMIASHNLGRLKDLCDIALYLENGKIKYFGDIDNAIEMYNKDQNFFIEEQNRKIKEENLKLEISEIDAKINNLEALLIKIKNGNSYQKTDYQDTYEQITLLKSKKNGLLNPKIEEISNIDLSEESLEEKDEKIWNTSYISGEIKDSFDTNSEILISKQKTLYLGEFYADQKIAISFKWLLKNNISDKIYPHIQIHFYDENKIWDKTIADYSTKEGFSQKGSYTTKFVIPQNILSGTYYGISYGLYCHDPLIKSCKSGIVHFIKVNPPKSLNKSSFNDYPNIPLSGFYPYIEVKVEKNS